MKENDPWIEATLAAFPADDPQNPQRRDLLAAASVAVPPPGPDDPPPGHPPAHFLARAKTSRRRALITNTILLAVSLALLWCQLLSPDARHDTQRILLAWDSHPGWVSAEIIMGLPNRGMPDPHKEEKLREDLKQRLPSEKILICWGDDQFSDPVSSWKAVWDASPDDPAVFATYVGNYFRANSQLPPDLVATADRIDPGNGYYRWLEARLKIEAAIIKSTTPTGRPISAIGDPILAEEARTLLQTALAAPRLQSHRSTILSRRLENWPAPHDFPDLMVDRGWFDCVQWRSLPLSPSFDLLDDFYNLEAERLAKAGDKHGMQMLCNEWRNAARRLANKDADANLWATRDLILYSWSLVEACEALGLKDEAEFFKQAGSTRLSSTSQPWEPGPQGCYFTQITAPQTYGPIAKPTEAEYRPARLAEHAMYERLVLTFMIPLSIAFLALIAGLQRGASRHQADLPSRLLDLLTPGDLIKTTLIGIGVPLLGLLFLLYTPALNFRHSLFWRLHTEMLVVKLVGFFVISLLLTSFMLLRSLAKRGHALGFSRIAPKRTLALGSLSLAAIAGGSLAWKLPDPQNVDREMVVMGTLLLLLIVGSLFLVTIAILCFTGHRKLLGATLLRSLTPYLVAFPLIFTLLAKASYQREIHYVSQVTYERIGPRSANGLTRVDRERNALFRKTYLDFLKQAPE